ncbi:MAG: hypothetical protein Q9174_000111 [Haloplaca sp. 1 TL-2023]
MYCLIQFYVQLKEDLAEHRPLLKVAAIKLVIFLSFWQTILISFLTSTGAIKPSDRIQNPDLRIGIPALLLCIEMALFSFFHLFAFSWQEYDARRSAIVASESAPGFMPDPKTAYLGGPLGTKALLDAFNPWDLVKAIGRGFRWAAVGRRNREADISYRAYKISRPVGGSDSLQTEARNMMPDSAFELGTGGKKGRYRQLQGEHGDDDRRLLSHPQAVPLSDSANVYPRPGMRLPGDSGQELYDAPMDRRMPPTNHMRSHQEGQQQTGIVGLANSSSDTAYHGASLAPSYPLPSHQQSYPRDRTSFASSQDSESDPDDWSAWSGAHGPHNQSDVARLSAEHIDRARLSAEQEARSRRTSDEPGGRYLDPQDRSRERGPSPSEVWQGMQGHGVRHADRNS